MWLLTVRGQMAPAGNTAHTQGVIITMDLFIFRTWLNAKLHRNEQGANLVEYILLIAFIAIVVLIAVQTLGTTVSSKFSSTTSSLS